MPIYEYSCDHCRMIYQFFVRSISSAQTPACPRCGATDLKRLLSSFAPVTGSKGRGANNDDSPAGNAAMPGEGGMEGGGAMPGDPFAGMSPERQAQAEREMFKLMSQAESLDENDPRQMGHFMEKMMGIVGQDKNREVQEAIRRLKAGEDPEKVEAEMGDVFGMGGEEGPAAPGGGEYGYDNNLYDM